MKIRILYIIVNIFVFFIYSVPSIGQSIKTISFNNGSYIYSDGFTKTMPVREVKIIDNGIVVNYTFNHITIQDDFLFPGSFFINVDGFGRNSTIGEPSVLYRMDSFTMPIDAVGSVEIIDSSYVELPMLLAPSRPLLNDMGYNSYSHNNVIPIKPYMGLFPQSLIQETETNNFRGNNIFDVYYSPMKYDYQNKKIYFYNHITYKITFTETESKSRTHPKYNYRNDLQFLKNSTINGLDISPRTPLTKSIKRIISEQISPIKKDYLIISTPSYQNAVNKIAQWKRLMGFNVHVDLRNSWNVSQIKASVDSIYDSCDNLVYLLIIGDHEDVPAEFLNFVEQFYTDYNYGCINNDKYQEVCVGRLPVSNSVEANIVVDKIIDYEKTPVNDSAFYKTGLNCAYFQDGTEDKHPNGREDKRYALTSEKILRYLVDSLDYHVNRVYCADDTVFPTYWSNYFSMGEEIPYYLKKENGFQWNGNGSNIIDYINEGTFYVIHRDHGGVNSWWRPNFTKDHINLLNNHNKLPVVFSINCLTGDFTKNSCFAESFLRKEDGGCVAIFCPTASSFSGHNDILLLGMFDAIWPNPGIETTLQNVGINTDSCRIPLYALGDILRQGKKVLDESNYENISIREFTRKIYHCLGDPSMLIYTKKPTVFNSVMIKRTSNKLNVELVEESGTITFLDLMTDSVVSFVGQEAEYCGNNLDSVMICISGHNKIPYIVNPNQNDFYYIQNDTIQGDHIFKGKSIKVGTSVTDMIPQGDVVFDGGKTTIVGKEVTIEGKTTIKLGTEFEILNE